MASDKYVSGNTTMLILKMLEGKDMYGYQIIEELAQKSNDIFHLKTGTLYPILHRLENDSMLSSYDEDIDNIRTRRYYHITDKGKNFLFKRHSEWTIYAKTVNNIMEGDMSCAII